MQTTTIQQEFRMQRHIFGNNCPLAAIQKLHRDINSSYTVNCKYSHTPPEMSFGLGNLLTILVLIPLCDRLMYICLSGWKALSMFGRITIGQIFLLLSIFTGLLVEVYRLIETNKVTHSPSVLNINAIPFHTESTLVFHVATPISACLILPQYFLFAFAEVFANITS